MSRRQRHRVAAQAPAANAAAANWRQLKPVLLLVLPVGALAVGILGWPLLFPVPPERLVEVAWRHECGCAAGWMERLRTSGYTVRDFEMDDLSTFRQQRRIPETAKGCHPATYLGYYLEGHIPPEALRRLAGERPSAAGLKQIDTSRVVLVEANGSQRPW